MITHVAESHTLNQDDRRNDFLNTIVNNTQATVDALDNLNVSIIGDINLDDGNITSNLEIINTSINNANVALLNRLDQELTVNTVDISTLSTHAKQDTINTSINNANVALLNRLDQELTVNTVDISTLSTHAKQDTINTSINNANVALLSRLDQELTVNTVDISTLSTHAKQDTINTSINNANVALLNRLDQELTVNTVDISTLSTHAKQDTINTSINNANVAIIDTLNNLSITTDNTDITSNLEIIQTQQKYTTENNFDNSNAFPTFKLVGLHPAHGGLDDDYHTIHATENGELKVNITGVEATEAFNVSDTDTHSNLQIIQNTQLDVLSNIQATQPRSVYGSDYSQPATENELLVDSNGFISGKLYGLDYSQPNTEQALRVSSSGVISSKIYGYNGSNDTQLQMDSDNNLKTTSILYAEDDDITPTNQKLKCNTQGILYTAPRGLNTNGFTYAQKADTDGTIYTKAEITNSTDIGVSVNNSSDIGVSVNNTPSVNVNNTSLDVVAYGNDGSSDVKLSTQTNGKLNNYLYGKNALNVEEEIKTTSNSLNVNVKNDTANPVNSSLYADRSGGPVKLTADTNNALYVNVSNSSDIGVSVNNSSDIGVSVNNSSDIGVSVNNSSDIGVSDTTSQGYLSTIAGRKTVKEYRNEGKNRMAFCAMGQNGSVMFLSNNTTDKVYYVYNIKVSMIPSTTDNDRCAARLYLHDGYQTNSSSITAISYANAQLYTEYTGSVNKLGYTSSINNCNFTGGGSSANIEVERFVIANNGNNNLIDFQEEWLELGPNTSMSIHNLYIYNNPYMQVCVRWIEEDI